MPSPDHDAFAAIKRYWSDPKFAAAIDAEAAANQARAHAAIDVGVALARSKKA